jgi:type IV pilus assembly protein PilM
MTTQVTLFVEDTDIKLLLTKDRQVEKWASLLLPPGLVSDGVIEDEAQVAERINELFQLQEIRTRKVTTAVSGLNSIFRVITLPELPAPILPEAIRNEANRVIPMPLEQVYLAHQTLPSPPGETRVFLVAFPRNSTDTLVRTLDRAGLSIKQLDIAPLALVRNADVPRAVIVNSWLSNADIVVMTDNVPQVIRSLSLPTESATLADKLPSIAEELNRTIAFYHSSHTDHQLDSAVPLFVAGDLSQEPESWPALVGKLKLPVSALPSLMKAPEAFDSGQYMVNIGLALKELLPPSEEANHSIVNFNALPEIYRPKGIAISSVLAPVVGIAAIGALVYGGIFIQNMRTETEDLRAELTTTRAAITQEQATIASLQGQVDQAITPIQPIQDKANTLEDLLITLRFDRENVVGDIKTVESLARHDDVMDLNKIEYVAGILTVEGTISSDEEQIIFDYAYSLRASGRFSEVVVSLIEGYADEDGEVESYSFKFTLL